MQITVEHTIACCGRLDTGNPESIHIGYGWGAHADLLRAVIALQRLVITEHNVAYRVQQIPISALKR